MTRSEQIRQIIDLQSTGLYTETKANAELDKLKVRGGFDGLDFTGYDYQEQKWITEER